MGLLPIGVRLQALLPADWLGVAGERFRKTGKVLAEFTEKYVRPEERVEELPDLAWNRVKGEANEKHSQALVNFAEQESKKIANELAKRTADDLAREAKASADKMEAEARLSQTNELTARISLIKECRTLGVLPIWNRAGDMTFLRAPSNVDWEELTRQLLTVEDSEKLRLVQSGSDPESSPGRPY